MQQSPASPPPPAPSSYTHKNKFFDNHEYSRRSLKLLEYGEIYEVRAFFQGVDSGEA